MMNRTEIIQRTADYVKDSLSGAEGGHDWWHIYRVWRSARHIAESEKCDIFTVELGALLHDIADSKFNDGDDDEGPRVAGEFLRSLETDEQTVNHVQNIIRNVSFKGGSEKRTFTSRELDVVQDADRLDAIGAIGIARAFSYGGFKGREMYNPGIKPDLNMTKDQYRKSSAPSLNHFYEKLLLLKDLMNTAEGKIMAEQRHSFMELYLEEFYREWEGEA